MRTNRRKRQFPVPRHLVRAAADQERIARTGDKSLIDDDIYKGMERVGGRVVYRVRDRLGEIYFDKCAYCEIKEFKPEVEHYRPKKRVSRVRNHPGYYWLCYEWTNLLPSCRYCNTEGGKGNKFPVRGNQLTEPPFKPNGRLDRERCRADQPPLSEEAPYLLNPEVDEPEDCFAFDNKGKMRGVDETGRGKKTIEICNLNRDNLRYRRQKIVDQIKTELIDALAQYFEVDRSQANLFYRFRQIFRNLDKRDAPEEEFSLMHRYCFRNFIEVVSPLLPTPDQREIVSEGYRKYKTGQL